MRAVNVSSAVQAPLTAAGSRARGRQATRCFCHAPRPQTILCSMPSKRATSVTERSSSPFSSLIASSLRSLSGNTNFLPNSFQPVANRNIPNSRQLGKKSELPSNHNEKSKKMTCLNDSNFMSNWLSKYGILIKF